MPITDCPSVMDQWTKVAYRGGRPSSTVTAKMLPVSHLPLIAIVDDDPSVRRSLRRLVQSAGYRVQTFATAPEFLEALPGSPMACLVLDVHLDGMSGLDLQERLHADGTRVPIIFITAHDDAPTRARVEGSGAAAYLWKPFDDIALLEAIRGVVGTLD
jgi:FixJ family two-component response regulator